MKKISNVSLLQCLLSAASLYDSSLNEEQGGFILDRTGKFHFEFVPIPNKLTGTPEAGGLYIAHPEEFNNKVAFRILDDEWNIFASYHTHPMGMRAMPSLTDITKLFTSFPVNFIYAPGKELNRFDYNPNRLKAENHSTWLCTNIMTLNGFEPSESVFRPKMSSKRFLKLVYA